MKQTKAAPPSKAEATLDDLVDQVGNLTNATTDLLNATNIGKENLDTAVTDAEASANRADSEADRSDREADRSKSEADRSTTAKTASEAAKTASEAARDAATAIVYEGEATLVPAPGKLAVADEEGKFHHEWLRPIGVPTPDFHMPLSSDIHIREGSGTATFTRASKKTCISPSGQLIEVEADQPAFEKEGILIEGSSTNVNTQSSRYSNLWVKYGGSLYEENSTDTLLGLPTDTVTYPNTGNPRIERRIASTLGITYTYSVFVKGNKGETTSISIHQTTTGSGGSKQYILTGGWDKLSITETTDSDSGEFIYRLGKGGNDTATSIIVGCHQLESLPFPTSYIPTNGTPVTRAADLLTLDESSIISSQFSMSYILDVFGTNTKYSRIWIGIDSGINSIKYGDQEQGFIQSHKIGDVVFSDHYSQSLMQSVKFFYVSDDATGTQIYKDGIMSSGTMSELEPTTSYSDFFINSGGYSFFHIKDLKIWNQALTPEQIYNL